MKVREAKDREAGTSLTLVTQLLRQGTRDRPKGGDLIADTITTIVNKGTPSPTAACGNR